MTIIKNKIILSSFKEGIDEAINLYCDQIINWANDSGIYNSVIGLSGGIDSTATAYIYNTAFNRFNKNKEEKDKNQLFGVIMPSIVNSPKSKLYALEISEMINIEIICIDIEPIKQSFVKNGLKKHLRNEYDVGGLYSEIRGIILSRIAAGKNARIAGTGNHEEDTVLGYFNKRGDGAVDENIFANTPKRLVREVAKHLGVSKNIIERIPTAELWEGQTDESEIMYSYDTVEEIWEGYMSGYDTLEIHEMTGYDISIIEDIWQRNISTDHKRNTIPSGEVLFSYNDISK